MNNRAIANVLFVVLPVINCCWAGGCLADAGCDRHKAEDVNSLDTVLEQLNHNASELRSYQAQIEYLVRQPLFESQTLRKGVLYYRRTDDGSALRINFQTLKQDDEKEQKYVEQYVFDGVWLTHIDYQIKQLKRYQQAEPNRPIDAFELAGRGFPVIGFTKTEDLEKQFEIGMVEQGGEAGGVIKLHLKVRPDSVYKNDYVSVNFWIDKKLYLPAKIVALSTEEEIHEIEFIKPKVNAKIDKKAFDVKVPAGFGEEIIPLRKSD